MARRSPTMPGHALPAGGRSSGSRPKKRTYAKSRKAAAKATKKAKREVSNAEFSRKLSQRREDLATKETRTAGRQAKAKMHTARQKASTARRKRMLGNPSGAKLSEVGSEIARDRAVRLKKHGVSMRSSLGKNPYNERQAKRVVKARKAAKAAKSTERKINRLADFGEHIAKRAATLKAQRGNRNQFLMDPNNSQH